MSMLGRHYVYSNEPIGERQCRNVVFSYCCRLKANETSEIPNDVGGGGGQYDINVHNILK